MGLVVRVTVPSLGLENEVRVAGPPGTGKTTWIAASVKATVKARMSSRVTVCSFTKAAAAEAAGRHMPIEREQVGTLHALAFRSIGRPKVASGEVLSEWNKHQPALSLSEGIRVQQLDEAAHEHFSGATDGDRLMMEVEILRARMVPRDLWPARSQAFSKRWEAWKQAEDLIDFTDMIERALHESERAPGDPLVMYVDEAQDHSPLELSLVRKWGAECERLVVVGDDDQCLYSFRGCTPEAFLDPPLPDEQLRVLSQSHRIPAAVHVLAQRWVSQLTRRWEKLYHPREEQGAVRMLPHPMTDADALVRRIEPLVEAGKTVMFLGACSYMLDPMKRSLRAAGLPFHNPYRRSRGDWNPLQASRGVSSTEKLLAYLVMDERLFGEASRLWTGEDVKRWSSLVKAKGVFRTGAKTAIGKLPDRELSFAEVANLFESEEELEKAVEPSLDWYCGHLLSDARGRLEFPVRVVRRRGVEALTEAPKVVIGTIHSVKGGQADVVILSPDLSLAGQREWDRGRESRDSVIRQFYVGMTRAKEELWVTEPSTTTAIDPRRLIG